MNTHQKGFTLAEITIAVSVIAALIIPSLDFYDKSIAKASLSGVFPAVAEVMNAVQEHYAYHGDLPNPGFSGDGTPLLDGPMIMNPQPGTLTALGRTTAISSAVWHLGQQNSTFNDALTLAVGGSQTALEQGGADWGYVEVKIKDNNTLHQTIRNKTIRFYFIESENRNKIEYMGCNTDLNAGLLDGTQVQQDGTASVADVRSIYIPECFVGLGLVDSSAGPADNDDFHNPHP
jgi:prepilin-type N-terminal cleavage/methylation domain-containing protein